MDRDFAFAWRGGYPLPLQHVSPSGPAFYRGFLRGNPSGNPSGAVRNPSGWSSIPINGIGMSKTPSLRFKVQRFRVQSSKLKVISRRPMGGSKFPRKQGFRSRQVPIGPDRSRQVQFWRRQSGSYRELSGPRRWEQKELSGPVGVAFPGQSRSEKIAQFYSVLVWSELPNGSNGVLN